MMLVIISEHKMIYSSVLWIICVRNESNIRFAQICLYDRIACHALRDCFRGIRMYEVCAIRD